MEVRKSLTNGQCVEEHLKLIEIDFIGILSTEKGEN